MAVQLVRSRRVDRQMGAASEATILLVTRWPQHLRLLGGAQERTTDTDLQRW
jgi:hypothetical protein